MKMIKRTLCLVLSLIMVLGMFPMQAFATDDGLVTDAAAAVQPAPVVSEPIVIPEPVIPQETVVVPEPAPLITEETVVVPEPAPVIPEETVVVPEPTAVPVPAAVSVYFVCDPAQLSLSVFDAYGGMVYPQADGSYLLLPGSYFYSAYCDGYTAVEAVPFMVSEGFGIITVDVVLAAVPVEEPAVPEEPEIPAAPEEIPAVPEEVPETEEPEDDSHSCDAVLESVVLTDGSSGWYCPACGGIFDANMAPALGSTLIEAEVFNAAVVAGTFNGAAAELDAAGNLLLNSANFPDAAFRQYLSANHANTNTAYLTAAEAAAVRVIDCAQSSIASLKGIEYFSALSRLYCSGNALSSLDLSGISSLSVVDCSDNGLSTLNLSGCTSLTELNCADNRLSTLDVSSCTTLETLICGGNLLAAPDFSANTALSYLSSDSQSISASAFWGSTGLMVDMSAVVGSGKLGCISSVTSGSFDSATGLVSLGIPADGLSSVSFGYVFANMANAVQQQSMGLTHVTVSCAVPEKPLYINEANFPDAAFRQYISDTFDTEKAGYLSAEQVAAVREIYCSGKNIYSLAGIEYFTALSSLDCSNNHIAVLNLAANTAITSLGSSGQTIEASAYWSQGACMLDLAAIVGAENLAKVENVSGGSFDAVTGLVTLSVPAGGTDSLAVSYNYNSGAAVPGGIVTVSVSVSIPVESYIYIDSRTFPDPVFRQYVSDTYDTEGAGYVTAEQLAAVSGLYLSGKGISSLKGIEYFTGITTLNCQKNSISTLDLSANTKLSTLNCYNNNITALNISGCSAITALYCYNNDLTALDVSGCSALTTLNCSANNIAALNLSANTALLDLDCSGNALSALDLSACANLKYLACSANNIAKLNLAANTKLVSLDGSQSIADSAYWDGDELKYDLTKLMGSADLAQVSSLTGGQLDSSTGIISLTAPESGSVSLSYVYDTKAEISIPTITVSLELSVPQADESSKCGDDLIWSFESATGVLTISGSGEMYNYAGVMAPWASLPYSSVVIESGVGSISEGAFPAPSAVITIKSGASVTLKGRISLGSGSKLLVEEGASLDLNSTGIILNGGTLEIKGAVTSANNSGSIIFYPASYSGGIESAIIGSAAENVELLYSYTVADAAGMYAALDAAHASASITVTADITVDRDISVHAGSKLIVQNAVLTIPAQYSLSLDGSLQTAGSGAKILAVREILVGEQGVIMDGTVIEYINCEHDWEEKEVLHEASCSEEGEVLYLCKLCGETKHGSIEKTDHAISQMSADYTACCGGYKNDYFQCSVCEGKFTDDSCEEEAVFSEAEEPSVLNCYVPNYTPCNGGCKEESYECHVCGKVYANADRTGVPVYHEPVAEHTRELTPADFNQCCGGFENDYYTCTVCWRVFADATGDAEPVYTPGTGKHNMQFNEAYFNECEGGYLTDYYFCLDCTRLYLDEEGTEAAEFVEGHGQHQLRLQKANYSDCMGGYLTDFYHCVLCLGDFVDNQAIERAEYVEGNGNHNLMQMTADYTDCAGGYKSDYFMCIVCGDAFVDEQCSDYATFYEGNGLHSAVSRKLPALPATNDALGLKAMTTTVCEHCGMYVKADGSEYSTDELDALLAPYLVYARASSVTLCDAEGNVLNSTTKPVELSTTESMQLYADILPTTAKEDVRWRSSSTTLATVSAEGLVTFLRPGTVTITATAADGSNKSANVKFDIQFKGITAAARFTAKIADESIGFVQPTKIGLQTDDSVQIFIYGVDKKIPLDPATYADLFSFTVRPVATGNIVEVDENGVVTGLKVGTASVTAEFKDDPLKRKVTFSVKVIQQQIDTVQIVPMDSSDASFVAVDAYGDFCSVSGNEPASYAIMIDALPRGAKTIDFVVTPMGTGVSGNLQAPAKGLYTWASTNGSLASVRENLDGTATITVKVGVDGACTITATSKDIRKAQGQIAVHLMNYSPGLEAATAVLDIQAGNESRLSLLPSYENAITGVEYCDSAYNSKTKEYEGKSTSIEAFYDNIDEQVILKATKSLKNQTIKGQLRVYTQKGSFMLNLNIQVKSTLPAVTVKQLDRFNVFDAGSSARFQVSVKGFTVEDIESIYFESNTANKAASSFTGSSTNSDIVEIFYDDFGGKLNTRGSLFIQLRGYAFPIEKTVTVGTITTKPSLALEPASVVISNAAIMDENTIAIRVKDRSGKVLIDLSSDEVSFSGTVPAGIDLSAAGEYIYLSADRASLEAYKGGRVSIIVKDSNWTSPITVSFSISKNNTPVSVRLAKSGLALNAAYKGVYDETQLVLSHANLSTDLLTVKELKATNASQALETEKLIVSYAGGIISASIKDGETVKAGTYAYSFIPVVGETELKPMSFTVRVTNTSPYGKLSKASLTLNNVLSGQVDFALLSANDKTQTIVPGSFDYKSKAAAGTAAAESADMIALSMDETGNITASIRAGMTPKAGTYSYEIYAKLTNGVLTADMKPMTLSVRIVNTQPRLSLSATTINLNTTAALAGLEKAPLIVKSASADFKVIGTRVEVADTNASLLPEYDKLTVVGGSGDQVTARLFGNNLPKLTTYRYRVYPTVQYTVGSSDYTAELNPMSFSVRVFNNANYTASVTMKGKLVSMNCDTSEIIYTVSRLNNVSGTVTGVSLSGPDKDLFAVSFGGYDAKGLPFAVLTSTESSYATNVTYKIQLDFTLDNNPDLVVSSPMQNVRVTNTALRLAATPKVINVYQSQSRARIISYTISAVTPAGARIGSVALGDVGVLQSSLVDEEANVYFVYNDNGSVTVKVVLKDTSKLSANRTYTLPLLIRAEGQASNTADAKLSLSLKVFK